MKITGYESSYAILSEIGNRIKKIRLSANYSQKYLSEKCGISLSTIKRIENGDDYNISNLIKVMLTLNITDGLELLIPEANLDYEAIFEQKPERKRAHEKREVVKPWIWGEDKEKE